jgi:MFS family permease
MCFALFMVMLDNTVGERRAAVDPEGPRRDGIGLEWTVNAYTLAFAVLLVTGGRLGDIFGRRRMFLFGVVTFAASSAFIGFSQTEAWLVAGRAVQGIGAAFMMPGTLSIISNAFPPAERGRAIGTWAGVSALALAIGPGRRRLPGRERLVAVDLLPEHPGRHRRRRGDALRDPRVARRVGAPTIDIPGVATLTIGLSALVLALVEANSWGWGSARIAALFATAVIGLTAFVLIELRSTYPMVDFDFFRSRSFLGANIVAFIVSFAMLAMFFFIALYMQNIKGYSPLEAGIRFLPRRS